MKAKKADVGSVAGMAISATSVDAVLRYGAAVKEHLAAYSGIDNDLGREWNRGLKEFSTYKISADPASDPKKYYQQLKSHAGYSAEVKEVARRRAEEAIAGKKPSTVRTDDLPGHVNDPLFDVTSKVDSHGDPAPESSVQMKFRGSNPDECLKILSGKDCRKYVDNNCKLMVPSDYYDGVKSRLSEKIKELNRQVEHLKGNGDTEALASREAELKKLKTISKNLKRSKVSTAEADKAYLSPEVSTAKDIVKVAHRAGIGQVKFGAAIGGGMSLVRNLVAVYKGQKTVGDAAKSLATDTSTAAAGTYAVAFTGAIIKGASQNSVSAYLRALSKTNLPAYIATATFEIGKTMNRFFRGMIDGVQCIDELGDKGYCMITSAMYATIGQVAIPIPVVGAIAGSMFGYFVGSASYKELKDSLKLAKLARAERIKIEKECEEAIVLLRSCRRHIQESMDAYLKRDTEFFHVAFGTLKDCLEVGDVDGYIKGTNAIVSYLGKKPMYANMTEFDSLMCDVNRKITV